MSRVRHVSPAMLIHILLTLLSAPLSIAILMHSRRVHPAYHLGYWARYRLGWRMLLNTLRVTTGVSYKLQLAMALKLLELSPAVQGDVVECGTWKGGTAVNLSLVCAIVGRRLRVYDSFQGLPPGAPGDRMAAGYQAGDFCGTLDEVRRNIRRHGALNRCEFIPGWFDQTLPQLRGPIAFAYIDVDLEASLDTCVRFIWPQLVDGGYLFTDEAVSTDYCALFYSERWWRERFSTTPPGLIGAGSGLPLGTYFVGPFEEREAHPLQHQGSGAYTRKGWSGYWTYYPDA